MAQKFFKCEICGNIIAMVEESGVPIECCGQEMTELTPNTSDGAQEKHVPVIAADGDLVRISVGEISHPMLPAHYIEWISIETQQGNQRKLLAAGQEPSLEFALVPGDQLKAAYAYCNLHGLWKKEA